MWTVIRSAEDWENYQKTVSSGLGTTVNNIAWGNPPESFPCLAATIVPPRIAGTPAKAMSAFVYEADAEELLKAAGRKTVDPDARPPVTQDQFNRWTAAQLTAIIAFLVDTAICRKEQFEEKMIECVEFVDAYRAGKLKDQAAADLGQSQVNMLDSLGQTG